ncbi:MAG: sulfatase-like hydrolase/transferase [Nitrospirota bacterium]
MKNIVLISIDNLRFDCIGYQPDKKELRRYDVTRFLETPNLDRLSEKSLCFTQCISTNTYTTSAHASLLTGLYPPRHGVRTFFDTKLSKDVYTLPEILKIYGYETVFSTDTIELFEPLDISRGFEHTFFLDDHNLFKFLKEIGDRKIFFFMHIFDVHEPYLYSKYEFVRGCNNDYRREMEKLHALFGFSFDGSYEKPHKLWGDFWDNFNRREIEYALPLFVKGVSKFDRGRFKWILSRLEEAGLMDDSIIIIFSDHGEGRCSMDKPSHFLHSGALFDNVIRVPLIIRHEDIKHEVRDELVSLIDIFPTIVELAAGDKIENILPYRVDGLNLLGNDKQEFVYSEVWTSKSPKIDFDATKNERFVFEFWSTDPSSIYQRGIRTREKKIVIYGKDDEFVDEKIFNLKNEEFLREIYRGLFNREIDTEGFLFLLEELNNNRMSKEKVYNHLLKSEEYKKQRNRPALMIFDLEKDPYEDYPFSFPREIFFRRGMDKGKKEINNFSDIDRVSRELDFIDSALGDLNTDVVKGIIERRLNVAGMENIEFFIDAIRDMEAMSVETEKAFKEVQSEDIQQ